jgi:hypothetical protein
MVKKLNVTGITNELQGASVFFPSPPPLPSPTTQEEPIEAIIPDPAPPMESVPAQQETAIPPEEDVQETPKPEVEAAKHESLQPREQASLLASKHDSVLAKIRETVRTIGKEVSYSRLTQEEKKRILDVIYTFRSSGIKISENELMRIAVNMLLEDYDLHKEESWLHKILHQ